MQKPIKILLLCLLASIAFHAQGQTYPINGGDVSVCSGALLDSGGQGGSGYGNNEDFTITICPGAPDSSISLSFVIFNLSAAGSPPADQLSIYDGNSTSAPLIGTWYGTGSPGNVSASFANPSGCLTVTFTSNETGTGVFAASISCHHPCEPPTAAAVMSEPAPALICQGESLGFDGSASQAAGGGSIAQWIWDFSDGTMDSTSGPLVDHVFQGPPAERVVHLRVRDANGCVSINPVDLQVLISTTPTFEDFGPITRCAGESVDLTAATHVSATTWNSIPDVNYGAGVFLPDDIGTPYSSTITFSSFPPGATLTDISGLLSVCVSMEHSFMGDFVLQLTAPNGTTVVFHQQGGGGTYLGIPVDNDNANPQPGTCWDYCFSPTATNGTWVDNAAGAASLPAGTYESLNPMSAFVGTPLNGTWTLTFNDLWALDNGFLCGWSINFDPSLLPDQTNYTPVPGFTSTDSSSWSGPDLALDPYDPLHYIATPTAVGPHEYTYTVTDNFGCSYDTTLTINITPGVDFTVSADAPANCGDPMLLHPELQLPLPTGTITYQWSPGSGLSSTSSPFPTAAPTIPTWYSLHAFPAGHPLCGAVDSVLVNPLTTMENDSVVTDHLCHGDDSGSIQVLTTGDGGPWNYVWTDSTGTEVQSTSGANGDIFHGPAGTYQVMITEGPNGNGCADSITATIQEPPPLLLTSWGNDSTICLTGTAQLSASAAGGTGTTTLHWDHGAGDGANVSASPATSTTFSVHATDANNCSSDTAEVAITVRPPLQAFLPDTFSVCPKVDLTLLPDSVQGGDGQYAYDWGTGSSTADSLTVNLFGDQTLCMTLSDGCETPPVTVCTLVDVTPVPPLVLTADSVLGCKPFTVQFNLEDTTGAATADWDFHEGEAMYERPMSVVHTYDHYGTFDLHVNAHWPNGCSYDSTYAGLIQVIDVPQADFDWSPYPATIFNNEVQFHELAEDFTTGYLWDFGSLGTDSTANPVITFPDDLGGHYPVQLTVWNYLGCADSTLRIVDVNDAFLVYVPTAFTPDGDGLNETLRVEGNDIAPDGFHWMIFDRWGEKVFDSTDSKQGWDGTVNGKKAEVGVYNWMLRAQSVYTGVNKDLRGHVTLVR